MKVELSSQDPSSYQVATAVYHGPLDLLLQLIERAELDVTELSLAQVTEQYLNYLENLIDLSADEVSSFLVIAAKLIQIKSEMLLPRPPIRELGEEDPGEALTRQLLLYRKYKRVAESLDALQKLEQRTYTSLAPVPDIEGKVDIVGVSLADLLSAANEVYARIPDEPSSLDTAITPPKVTIRQKIQLLSDHLRRFGRSTFGVILGDNRSREDIGITFLALLELVKMHFIDVHQEEIFSDIMLEPARDWEGKEDFELEFGE
jgi:segregation and condensation protein A